MKYCLIFGNSHTYVSPSKWKFEAKECLEKWAISQLDRKYKQKVHIKIKLSAQLDDFNYEIEAYQFISNLPDNLSPKLIDSGYFEVTGLSTHPDEYPDVTFYVTYIITKYCGLSLSEKYIDETQRAHYVGPGASSSPYYFRDTVKHWDTILPKSYIPDHISQKALNIINKLRAHGVYHDDIHPGNFLIDDKDHVYVIDFQSVSYY